MNRRVLLIVGVFIIVATGIVFLDDGEEQVNEEAPGEPAVPDEEPTEAPAADEASDYPKIASWLAKKDELIESGKPYDLVMACWFTPEEAARLRENNPDVLLLAGLTNARGLDLDVPDGKMYWADTQDYAVYRANLDGSNVEAIATGSQTGRPTVDLVNRKVYYGDYTQQVIRRCNLAGPDQ